MFSTSPLNLPDIIIYFVCIFCGTGERNRGYALLMMANKPETALYRAPIFSLLVASRDGISSRKSQFRTTITVLLPGIYILWHGREKSRVCSADDG